MAEPPSFFLDRCLAPRVADGLRASGWIVECITEHFPKRAEETPDGEWLALACAQGGIGLTQDAALWKLSSRRLPVFCLADGNLKVDDKIAWFLSAEAQIMKLAHRYTPGMWMVNEPPRPVRSRYKVSEASVRRLA